MVCSFQEKDCEVYRDGCARVPQVARGLRLLLSSPGGKPVTRGTTSPGIVYSKMFGVSTCRKNIHVRWLPRPMQGQCFYDHGT